MEERGDEGVQQMINMVCPVQQGLLAVRGMRPWCGAAVGVPSIRSGIGRRRRGREASGTSCPDAGAVAGAGAGGQGHQQQE